MPARKTTGAVADGKGVWFWHPWLVSSRRRFSGPNRVSESRQFAGDGGKREIRLQGERAISRKTIAQGRPDAPVDTCMLVCAFVYPLHTRPRVPASPRPSLRPLNFGGLKVSGKPRASRA